MSTNPGSLRHYLLVLVMCAIALPIAWKLDAHASSFMLVVMISCLYGGRGPGIFAIILSALIFDFFFLPPPFHFVHSHDEFLRLGVSVTAMVLAAELIEAKRRSDTARSTLDAEFRLLAETCPDGIIIIDRSSVIQFANPAVTRLFGFQTDEVLGRPASFLLPTLQDGQSPAGEFSAVRKSGVSLDLEATCGHLEGKTTIFLRDISERKKAQRLLEENEENMRLILETIPGLVYSRSEAGDIEYANRRVTDYFGKSLEEIRAGAWTEALHPDEKESVLTAMQHNFALGKPYAMEDRRRRFDGIYRWFQTNFQPLKGPDGKVIRWYALLTDIEERRNAELSLQRTQAKLAQATQIATISEFAASVIHEISQPLSAMVANGQTCVRWLSANPPNNLSAKAAAERVVRDGKDAGGIIKGLRALFKRSSPQKSLVDLREVIDEVVALVRGRAERYQIVIDVQSTDNLPKITGDRIQLQQVLMNLISNAIDSMLAIDNNKPRKIWIRAQKQDGVLLTEVEDGGAGIADFNKVFDAFFTTKESGMGMGLSICKSIIEAHEGRLWGSPGPVTGAVFSFTIPYMAEDRE
jgi:PAS domain S-box-containing protein